MNPELTEATEPDLRFYRFGKTTRGLLAHTPSWVELTPERAETIASLRNHISSLAMPLKGHGWTLQTRSADGRLYARAVAWTPKP